MISFRLIDTYQRVVLIVQASTKPTEPAIYFYPRSHAPIRNGFSLSIFSAGCEEWIYTIFVPHLLIGKKLTFEGGKIFNQFIFNGETQCSPFVSEKGSVRGWLVYILQYHRLQPFSPARRDKLFFHSAYVAVSCSYFSPPLDSTQLTQTFELPPHCTPEFSHWVLHNEQLLLLDIDTVIKS